MCFCYLVKLCDSVVPENNLYQTLCLIKIVVVFFSERVILLKPFFDYWSEKMVTDDSLDIGKHHIVKPDYIQFRTNMPLSDIKIKMKKKFKTFFHWINLNLSNIPKL